MVRIAICVGVAAAGPAVLAAADLAGTWAAQPAAAAEHAEAGAALPQWPAGPPHR
jgi:hypothetical protein